MSCSNLSGSARSLRWVADTVELAKGRRWPRTTELVNAVLPSAPPRRAAAKLLGVPRGTTRPGRRRFMHSHPPRWIARLLVGACWAAEECARRA